MTVLEHNVRNVFNRRVHYFCASVDGIDCMWVHNQWRPSISQT